ncbi:hepatocyte growth factor-regulated tyrosine kinase substrate isoform X2 [Zootermopsis nevadensis]|uniref:Hepatocyte growth factor-regulated tyrosine kinase substrate n=1 Tax=Zootermopsis nevadensis TaxID=136037 RepID=A0A067R0B4_ZOONE|nr:hepatocyte growth factor-regulated tyrosine kinase substrate isoform X2 [Zootermopsis nevadensis]KDR10856.1 Hepatocyte growth factor-regulated tyrosine kinase substrate [Zootermopsis nevadensis]
MFRSTSSFDKLLDKATSNLRLEPDWPAILQICDLIRQGDVQSKYALIAIKKKLYNANPHIAMFGLQVLESCVKNCGNLIHDEIGTKQYMEQLRDLVKSTSHDDVKNKVLELIQAWAYAFRNSPKYRAVQDTVNIMKTEGCKFPVLKESDAMFSADTAPEWADGDVCHRCRVQFGMMQRKHHCRACGQVFCGHCSSKTSTLPKFGIEKEVRVCEACYEILNKPTSASQKTDGELPAEYVSSSLAQQSQSPPRKSEDELREEEELQLALALSKSEAEHKEKEKKRTTSAMMSGPSSTNRAKQYSPPPAVDTAGGSPSQQQTLTDDDVDPELARYLNRSYWEQRQSEEAHQHEKQQHHTSDRNGSRVDSPLSQQPSAPMSSTTASSKLHRHENGETDTEMEEFVTTLKTQVEIFVNRMKSNSSRGRSIANDSSVQTLFMNITAMHSRLLKHIQQQDDSRVYYEGLQDKLAQVKDARAALDALREEHHEKLRRQAEEAERIRQMQMAHKLQIMRKKKQEYLQYQRQLALQRIQEQEREMQIRQEQQKQQYLMGSSMPYNMQPPYMPGHGPGFGPASADGSPVHGNQFSTVPGPNSFTSLQSAATSAGPTTYRDFSGLYSVPNVQALPGQGPIPGGPVPHIPQGHIPAVAAPGAMHSLPRGMVPGPVMGPVPIPGQVHGPPRPIQSQRPPIQGPVQGPQLQGQGPAQLPQGPVQVPPHVQGGPMQVQRPPQMQGQGHHQLQGQVHPPQMQHQGPQQIPGQGSQSQGPPLQMQGPPGQTAVPQNQPVPGQPIAGAQGPQVSHYSPGGVMMPSGETQPPQGPTPGSSQQQQQTAELISFD